MAMMMMMMAVKVEVLGQTTATGNILVDSSDTVASSSGRDQAIIIITITATTIIVIINVIAIAIANIITTIVIIITTIPRSVGPANGTIAPSASFKRLGFGPSQLKSEALPVARNIGHPTTSLHSSSRQRYPVCPH